MNNTKEKNVPRIRFPKFTDAWEQRKLSEILTERHCFTTINDEYPRLSFTIEEGVISPDDRKTNKRDFLMKDEMNKKFLITEVGDIIYNPANVVFGALHKNKYAKGCLSPIYRIFFSNYDTTYLECILRADSFIKALSQKTEGTVVKLKTLKPEAFLGMEVFVTSSLEEQKKIAYFFDNLDNTITLHQRKCDQLKEIKKAMLQKMFPKDGQNVPEIRFPGFTDAWEQRKLGEVVNVGNGRDYKHLDEGDIPVYGTGGYMLSVSEALSDDEDAIGIGRKGTIDKPYILRAPFWTVDTLFYCIPKENYDLNFAFDIFQNINWKLMDESTGVPSLSKTAINNVDVWVPNFKEQQKIGSFFEELDNTITLHQRKCNEWKELKKALLQQMFI